MAGKKKTKKARKLKAAPLEGKKEKEEKKRNKKRGYNKFWPKDKKQNPSPTHMHTKDEEKGSLILLTKY